MSELVFEYRPDPSFFDDRLVRDDFGRLDLSVSTQQFSGRGGFWVQWQDVVKFGESLIAFPIDPSAPPSAKWGYREGKGEDLILGVTISPANSTGDLLVSVEIGTVQQHGDRLRAAFLTNYPDIERFRRALTRLMNGEVDQAALKGR